MTIEQAIKHAEEVAQEKRYEYQECLAVHDMEEAMDCRKCGEEHRQLAAWLRELQARRKEPKKVKGRWIEMLSYKHTYKCSECGRLLVNITDGRNNVSKHYPYCHCGADMKGEPNDIQNK